MTGLKSGPLALLAALEGPYGLFGACGDIGQGLLEALGCIGRERVPGVQAGQVGPRSSP